MTSVQDYNDIAGITGVADMGEMVDMATNNNHNVRKNATTTPNNNWNVLRKGIQEEKTKHTRTYFVKRLIIGILLLFLVLFILLITYDPDAFAIGNADASSNSVVDGFYYWGTVTSTVGFGDICPKKAYAKVLTTLYQLVLVMISMGGIWYFTDGRLKSMMKVLHKEQRQQQRQQQRQRGTNIFVKSRRTGPTEL